MDILNACKNGDVNKVKELILEVPFGEERLLLVNQEDSVKSSLLHIAVCAGNEELVRLLVNCYANVCAKNSYGMTPLAVACVKKYTNIIRILVYRFYDACRLGQIDKVKEIIKVDPTAVAMAKTAIHCAAYSGRSRIAKLLIEAGAVLNWRNRHGYTALDIAARDGRDEIARMLIDGGTDCSKVRGYVLILYDVDILPSDKQLEEIPAGHVLYKKYYFHKAHDYMDDFGMRVDCFLKAEEYDVVSRIVAEKCGLPFGETPEIRSMVQALNFCMT